MSKNVKILLIIGGILAGLAIFCVGSIFILRSFKSERAIKILNEGKEFGKTTDNFGCQTNVLSMIKPLRETDIEEIVDAQYFFGSCLETSTYVPSFCEGLPSDWKDILDGNKAKNAECEKLGFKNSNICRHVMTEKLDYCAKKR